MAVRLIDILKQKNDADFALLEDIDLLGGLQVVADLAGRDAVPTSRRKEGMVVSQADDGTLWQLIGGIGNGDWQEFSLTPVPSAWKEPVEIATVADANWTSAVNLAFADPVLTITGLDSGGSLGVIDSYEPIVTGRVLVKDAQDAVTGALPMNGIWEVTGGTATTLTLERAAEANTAALLNAAVVRVLNGTQTETAFSMELPIAVLDTDDVTWSILGGALAVEVYVDEATLTGTTPDADQIGYATAEGTIWLYILTVGWASFSGMLTVFSYADMTTLLADTPVQDTIGYAIAEDELRLYVVSEAAWKSFGSYSAVDTTFTPDGDIAATDVQAAVVEVRDDTDTKLGAKQDTSEKGAAGGYPELDGGGKVPAGQLPSYVDDVEEYANVAAFPGTGETGKIYLALDSNKTYRWTGSVYVEISSGIVPTSVDLGLTPAVTAGDDSDTTLAITNTPTDSGRVLVAVNGILYAVGNAVKTAECYFTADSGATARPFADIAAADALYWNGAIVGFELAVTDRVDILYSV